MSFLSRIQGTQPEGEFDRVVRNLGQVLNIRKEYGSVLPTLGLGDYEGEHDHLHGTHEALAALDREILEQVVRYEPRLLSPRLVRLGRDPELWLHFHLEGEVDGLPRSLRIKLHTIFRQVEVRAT
ncbi:MAG TPA: GPW/gp25 family protein [Polyangia bacterium]|jgi:predicted component of type VI protein secretion system|nr:GPW/gp25 family protein [Polyangia bacterium]